MISVIGFPVQAPGDVILKIIESKLKRSVYQFVRSYF